ncbi:histidine-rich glycoprotein-like [Cucurbita maxima]|uniref:Histidine-rich glycoprotein-like n=1 Tax=Cucurbita maxima TaxID=3661 RepID=A0A6J1L173_CUCMA|nr:histidine-rich glycoprotein-like [Cucurbita maxima]
MHGHGEEGLIVGVYVNDLIISRGDMEVLGRFKREMSKNFKMSDLGVLSVTICNMIVIRITTPHDQEGRTVTLSCYLNIEVQQSTARITICQSAYAKKLLDTAGLADSNPSRTPMEARLQLRKADTTTAVEATNYHNIVRILRYLVNIRPDLAYSVGYIWGLSRLASSEQRNNLETFSLSPCSKPSPPHHGHHNVAAPSPHHHHHHHHSPTQSKFNVIESAESHESLAPAPTHHDSHHKAAAPGPHHHHRHHHHHHHAPAQSKFNVIESAESHGNPVVAPTHHDSHGASSPHHHRHGHHHVAAPSPHHHHHHHHGHHHVAAPSPHHHLPTQSKFNVIESVESHGNPVVAPTHHGSHHQVAASSPHHHHHHGHHHVAAPSHPHHPHHPHHAHHKEGAPSPHHHHAHHKVAATI